jgi:hypothetical protein
MEILPKKGAALFNISQYLRLLADQKNDNIKRKDRQGKRKGKERKEMSRERDQERLNKAIRCARAMHSAYRTATGRQLK